MNGSKRIVAHFVRKNTQFKASFIRNQIVSHLEYEPILVWRSEVSKIHDGGFAAFDAAAYPGLNLSQGENWMERALFKGPKILSSRQVKAVLDMLKKRQVSLCHFHYGTDCGVFFPLLRRMNLPAVVSFYGYDCSSFPRLLFGYGSRYLQNRVFRDAAAVLAMSPDMKEDLMRAGCPEEKIIVHYYGTDCRRFFMEREYGEKKEIHLLILASLVPQKGHMFLFRSLLALQQAGVRSWKLTVIGVGELESQLREFAAGHGLTDQITFLGAIPYASPEMMEAYRRADVFVHPSVVAENGDKEGIPGTIIEAMSAGLPVISTYHAGIPYVIKDMETGLLVKEWDIDGLKDAIARLMRDPALIRRLGKNGQSFALESLDLYSQEQELERIYRQLIASGQTEKNEMAGFR